MRLSGPYYRIAGDHGTMHVSSLAVGHLRAVVGRLAECARIAPQPGQRPIQAGGLDVVGVLFPSGEDRWHVVLRIAMDGVRVPYWLSIGELEQLRQMLNAGPLPGEGVWTQSV